MSGSATDVDLACERSIRDPAGYFAEVRERGGAVQWSAVHRAWVIVSHPEVAAGFRDSDRLSVERDTFRRTAAGVPGLAVVAELLGGWMNFRDDPTHRRLREPVRAAFVPRAVVVLEDEIRAIVDRAIDGFAGEVVDLDSAFARPVPALVIGALLGAEPEDRSRFEAWSDDLARIVFSLTPGAVAPEPVLRAADQFIAFFSRLIERERARPSGNLLSALVHGEVDQLTPIELVGACTLLLFAGHETTTVLIDNALAILLERADLRDRVRANPGLAVEELMRTVGPARAMARKVAVAHVRGGRELSPRDTVFLSIAAANHDPAVFAAPSRLDLMRDPNPHLGFGWGPHVCLGTHLARLEAKIALCALLERFPDMAAAAPVPPLAGDVLGFSRRTLLARL